MPVTADDVLGETDRGFRVAMGTLNLFRPSVGAFAVGMAQAALDATLAHTAGRDAFGGKLRDLQAVSAPGRRDGPAHRGGPADGARGGVGVRRGRPGRCPRRSAMAKLLATETAQYVARHGRSSCTAPWALQRGHLLEHLYREVRAPRIYEGASEVQRRHHRQGVVRPRQEAR